MPPVGDGPHRYVFRVYAASAPLGLTGAPSAEDLRRALEGKELASGTLIRNKGPTVSSGPVQGWPPVASSVTLDAWQ